MVKFRDGFISNSSSSSFIINKDDLSKEQIEGIYNYGASDKIPKDEDMFYYINWNIEEDDKKIIMSTIMDNFDMYSYLIKDLGVKKEYIIEDF